MGLIDNESSVSHTVYVKSTLILYGSISRYTALTVTVEQAACDCSLLAWDTPAATHLTVAVAGTDAPLVPLPTADTATPSAIYPTFQKCDQAGTPCAETGLFSWQDITLADGSALPGWITYSSTGNQVQTIGIAPTDGTHTNAGEVWTIIAHFRPTWGPDTTYTAFVLTVTCEVTSWAVPAAPTTGLDYLVWARATTIDISSVATYEYVQTPPCGYTYSSAYTWTGLGGPVAQHPDYTGMLTVWSVTRAHGGTPSTTYPVAFDNEITVLGNGPAGDSTFSNAGGSAVSFDITITDPCYDVAINHPVLNTMNV